jgi:hypothetical protein
MNLPNGHAAIVPMAKLTDYLLSVTHPDGQHKALFFRRRGFTQANRYLLWSELRSIAAFGRVVEQVEIEYGTKFVVIGTIKTPRRKQITLKTIWIVKSESTTPRFVTAYPV